MQERVECIRSRVYGIRVTKASIMTTAILPSRTIP